MASSPQPTGKKQDRPPRRHWQAPVRPHWIEIVLAGALIVVGAAQVYIYIRQAGIMTSQAEIANGQLTEAKLARRAWVSIEPAVGNVVWDKDGVSIDLKFTIENTGNSPAMHVTVDSKIVPWIAPELPSVVLKRMTAEHRQRKWFIGSPVFPHGRTEIYSTQKFSREEMAENVRYLTTFKHDATDPPLSPDLFSKSIALAVVYLVDYTFETGDVHHQHSCMDQIVRVDPRKLIDRGVALDVDVDLYPPNVRLTAAAFQCDAD
jgi:hypothetical protein